MQELVIAVYYTGRADRRLVTGSVTGKKYVFLKDKNKTPLSTNIDNEDVQEILEKRKQKCKCSHPRRLFFTEDEVARAVAGEIDLMKL